MALPRIRVYLTSPEASPYRPALDAASEIIDGFQSPHGLELLATVDWLNRESGVGEQGHDVGHRLLPGPEGAAVRKARIFTRHHVDAAVGHLQGIQSGAT